MIDADVITVTIDRALHTVLVVDDSAATRYSTSRVLRAAGFQVAEAASGTEGIARAMQGVAGVVLDVHLPDIDGFEVCRTLRTLPATSRLPVIHLSAAHVRDEDRVAGLNAGADAYMVHPVEPAVLIATMQALIRARTAEEQLRRSEQRFRAIYDQAQSGIGLLNAAGCLTDANPAMLRMLGRSRDELIERPLPSMAPPDWVDTVTRRLASLDVKPWRGEFPLLAADGRAVHLEWSISPPTDPGLRIAIAIDASERHALDRRRRDLLEREQAARAAAERHSRTKDDFIAVLSHELRTPLNSIAGWVAVLMRRNPTPEAVKGLEAIERNVKAQARIISDILDVSRINSGKLRLDVEQSDPVDVVAHAIGALHASITEKALVIEEDLGPRGDLAWLDPGRFEQIFWNLMTNAIKFSHKGGQVRVGLCRDGDRLALTVQDFGHGIKPDFLPHLFDRFTQSDAPGSRLHRGLGLGLSIVRHLVELHGGTVQAESGGLGQGTTMRVEIPVGTAPDELPGAGEDSAPDTGADDHEASVRPLAGLDVLVVEDDPGACEMLAMVLGDRGARVRTAEDFDAAVRTAGQAWPDVLVSDIGLPGRDGFELIRELRRMQPPQDPRGRLAAVALTAFARVEDKFKALEAGFDAHLAKPLKPHVLVSAILGVRAAGGAGSR
jgi:PAS domain S-box-containing protein